MINSLTLIYWLLMFLISISLITNWASREKFWWKKAQPPMDPIFLIVSYLYMADNKVKASGIESRLILLLVEVYYNVNYWESNSLLVFILESLYSKTQVFSYNIKQYLRSRRFEYSWSNYKTKWRWKPYWYILCSIFY